MYEYPKLPDSYWKFWGTEFNEKGVKYKTLKDPSKPRVWFFGDSFVQVPNKNIWHPLYNEFNVVHKGVGGTSVDAVYMQLLACRHLIHPNDRVIIALSHVDREIGRDGIRLAPLFRNRGTSSNGWQEGYELEQVKQYKPPTAKKTWNNYIDEEIYSKYIKTVRWDMSTTVMYIAVTSSITNEIAPSLATNHLAVFNCFYVPIKELLQKYDVPYQTIKEMTPELKSIWDFLCNIDRSNKTKRDESLDADAQLRANTSNHAFDSDVNRFWNYYKGTLEKLCLDQPLYK